MSDESGREPTAVEELLEDGVEVLQPGLGTLRNAVANYANRHRPGPPKLREDGVAGLTTAINNVPDGMANGLLVGVNPVFGLYATMMGPFTGGLLSSTQLMVITTTAAASLTASQALIDVPSGDRAGALFVMVILVGVFQTIFGLLGLGRYLRFVSYSVTTGFLTGVAVLLILSQLSTMAGYEASGDNRVSQTLDLIRNVSEISIASVGLGIVALLLAVHLPRTRIGNTGRLLAIVVPSAIVAVFSWSSVSIVEDVSSIPSGFPRPRLPALGDVTFEVVTGALSVALIILIQGAGVSQSVPNPDGSRRSASRDFVAQGGANIVSGLFRGLPVGGSLSATALNVVAGARTRWSAIFAGLFMAAIIVAFAGLVSRVAMPALAAMLILAGYSSIKPSDIETVWRAGWPSVLAGGTTFLTMLFLPIQAAVGIGVSFSALLYIFRSSADIAIYELVRRDDGLLEERKPPETLPGNAITVLDVYGNLFFAAASTLEELLPNPGTERHPVVVLRMRGRETFGATLIDLFASYSAKLEALEGRLYLSGLTETAKVQVTTSGRLRLSGPVRVYEAKSILGESTAEAVADARSWLIRTHSDDNAEVEESVPPAPEGRHRDNGA